MNILSISLDKKIFEENSAVRQKQIEYGKLCEQSHIIVLGKNTAKDEKEKLSENTTAYGIGGNYFKRFLGAYKLAKKIIKKEKINFITAQDPFITGLLGWFLKKKFGTPLQLQIHTDFLSPYFWRESLKNKIYVLLAKFLVPKANGLRVVSKRIKKSLIQNTKYKIQNTRLFVLPIFVDAENIRNAPINIDLRKKYPQFDFIILMASRLSKEKNIGLAIDAMAEMRDANIRMHANDTNRKRIGLIIVGEGIEKKNIEFRIKNLGLKNNVILEKWNNDLASYYKSADLFLLTSNYEGYGLVVVEAMAAGLPVVMTDVGCAGEVIIHDKNGLIVPVGAKEELVAAFKEITKNSKKYGQIKEGAQNSSVKFTSKEEYLNLYKNSWEDCLK